MKHLYCALWLLALVASLSGCSKPDHIDEVNSPTPGVFFTVETYYGRGPIVPDFTRIYAHLQVNGKSDRKLVLDGDYLQNTKIIWRSPHDVTLCISDGYTDSFRNYVTLQVGKVLDTIHSSLREHCTAADAALSSNGRSE
jgi:hypothetical protein